MLRLEDDEDKEIAKDVIYHLLGSIWLGGRHQRIPAVIINGVPLHHSKDRSLDRDVGILGSLAGKKDSEACVPTGL